MLLAVVLWGFGPVGTRALVGLDQDALPATALVGLRYAIAAAMFAPALRGLRAWRAADWKLAALCGLIGVTGYNLPSTLGQRTVSAGLSGLLDGAEPLMIVLCAAAMQRRWPSRRTILASVLGLGGVALLTQGAGPELGDPAGIALVLTGAFLWAIYCVLVPGLIEARGALPVTAVTIGLGAIPMVGAGLPDMPALLHAMTAFQWAVTLVLTLGTSVIAMLCWNAGSTALGAEASGWFLYLLPVISLIGGAVLLHEPVRPAELAGGAVILASVLLNQRIGGRRGWL